MPIDVFRIFSNILALWIQKVWKEIDQDAYDLADLLDKRQGAYLSFFKIYLRFLVHILAEAEHLRAQKDEINNLIGTGPARAILLSDLSYAHADVVRPLTLHSFSFWPAGSTNFHCDSIRYVFAFLSSIAITPSPSGISWIELYILYLLRGAVSRLHASHIQRGFVHSTLKQAIRDFQGIVRLLIKAYALSDDGRLFNAPRTAAIRLKSLGISNSTPRLSFLPFVRKRRGSTLH